MPVSGEFNVRDYGYASHFDHRGEKASPGYYYVSLRDRNIEVQLTATERVGVHKYNYSSRNDNSVVVDLNHRDLVLNSELEIIDDHTIRGMRSSRQWAKEQRIYFEISFSEPFKGYKIFDNYEPVKNKKKNKGKNLITVFSFDDIDEIEIKVALSPTSEKDASKNMIAEAQNINFDEVKEKAHELWKQELLKIRVYTTDIDKLKIFYTALYHTMINPNIYNNADGSYLGRDMKKHKNPGFDYYTVFSLWDTYRAEHPLLTIIDKKRTNDFINTFLKEYQQGGLLPVWELASNETFCMIGYHSVPVIFDAYNKNTVNFNPQLALEAMKNSANKNHFGLKEYRKYGYIPGNKEHESVSKTLEYAYDDWCIAQMSKSLNDKKGYNEFIKRAQFYKNVFDPQSGFMRPKYNGAWKNPFDPAEVTFDFTEANSWQYSFYVPQDISGLIKLHGGKSNFSAKLDELFSTDQQLTGREQADITGLIGQYAHGNEPSHHMAYLYDYVNQPYKTQELTHKIMTELYKNKLDGLSGNEDCGQMSAWYVLSSLGFYQVCPGNNQFAIGTPNFNKAEINLENGNKFTIEAFNLSDKNYYIQAATLNRNKYNKSYIDYEDIMEGGSLFIVMDSIPNKDWGSADDEIPVSEISEHLLTINPYSSMLDRVFSDSLKVELNSIEKNEIYFTTDGSIPDKKSKIFTNLLILKTNTDLKYKTWNNETGFSHIEESDYYKTDQKMKLKLLSDYSPQYTGGGDNALIDNLRGNNNFRLGEWQGYYNTDFEAILDLGEIKEINSIHSEFLQDIGSWIWMPGEIEFQFSDDGINFNSSSILQNTIPDNNYDSVIHDFELKKNIKIRFIKIKARKYGLIPDWHIGAGNPSWIFIDEVWVE